MAKNITVTPGQLDTAAKKIESLANDYKKQYTELYNVSESLSSTWKGKDSAAFTSRIDGFKDDLEKMHSLMKSYSTFLTNTAKSYRSTQNDIQAKANKLVN